MSYVTQRTGPEVDNLLTRSETSVQQADGTVIVTVGPSSEADFATINDALTFLSKHVPVYETGVKRATIELETGFIMQEQVLVTDQDLGWITIRSGSAAQATSIASFTEGDEVTGSDTTQEVQITIGDTGGVGSNLNGQYVLLDFVGSSEPIYFWFNAGGGSDPNVANAVGEEVTILSNETSSGAAQKLRDSINAEAAFGAIVTGTVVTVTNATIGAVTVQPAFVGGLVDGIVSQRGFDLRSKTVVTTTSPHGYNDGDVIIIQNHRTPIEEVFYNGRWIARETTTTTFVLDFEATDSAYWDANKGDTITGEEGSTFASPAVIVDRSAITQVWEFFYYPAFGVARGRLPIIAAEFIMDTSSNPDIPGTIFNYFDGLCATDGGIINILPGFGFQNATGSNIYATRQSTINANGTLANFAGRHGVWAYSASIINARGVQANDCGWKSTLGSGKGFFGDAEVNEVSIIGADGFVTTGEVGEAMGSGIVATRNSIVNAEGCEVRRAEGFGILSEFGSLVTIGGHTGNGTVTGNGTRIPSVPIIDRNFRARGGGMITNDQGIQAPLNFNTANHLKIGNVELPSYLASVIASQVNGFDFTQLPQINGVDLETYIISIVESIT
jgi:hypothetical protein